MSKIRSPNYPALDLGAALEAMRPVYKAEHRNKMSRDTLAQHLGYTSLNGRALGKIGAVRSYGLIEGTGDGLWVSDDTIVALMAPEDSRERADAMKRRAFHPALFQQVGIDEGGNLPSETNLKYRLQKKGFTEEAAGKAAVCYLSTMSLVEDAYPGYNPGSKSEDNSVRADTVQNTKTPTASQVKHDVSVQSDATGTRREVITLDEGDVVITFPEGLSFNSYEDLEASFQLFLKKAKRRAALQAPAIHAKMAAAIKENLAAHGVVITDEEAAKRASEVQ